MIWWCRSDPINFSMPYSQIADLTLGLTLCRQNKIADVFWSYVAISHSSIVKIFILGRMQLCTRLPVFVLS